MPDRLGFNMYIVTKTPNGGREYLKADGKIIKATAGGAVDPEKVKYCYLDEEMLQVLTDEIARHGIKPQKGYLEGKLEAMENHLDDCRHLLKLDIPINISKEVKP